MPKYITKSAVQTEALGRKLGESLQPGTLITFAGEMGAGKTTFCRGIATGLGCTDPASSPTFAIVNYYRGPLPFAHFDLYRIDSEEDLEQAGFYDYLESGAVVAVEWSERVLIDPATINVRINIQALGETLREIIIEGAEGL